MTMMNSDEISDVLKSVKALVDAAQQLQQDPASIEGVSHLIERLKQHLADERQSYRFTRQNSESRKKLESLHNLIQYLEGQVERARKAAQRKGLKFYLANVSSKLLGSEMGRIAQSMESELQSWLDQQGVRELANVLGSAPDDTQVQAIASFEAVVRKGYDAQLQDAILSAALVEKLASLLKPGAASWAVQKEASFALSALLDFNKDIFVSRILMAKVVGNLLSLMNHHSGEELLILVCVLKTLLAAGNTVIVDEIFAQNGVPRVVELLDHELQSVQHAGMDCVFEMAYHGRVEVVQKMIELEVIKKLARLQHSNFTRDLSRSIIENGVKLEEDSASHYAAAQTRASAEGANTSHPFANAVTRFAFHLAVGTGLRKRERRALKQEFLKQIKDVMHDDTEVANITAEVLWAP